MRAKPLPLEDSQLDPEGLSGCFRGLWQKQCPFSPDFLLPYPPIEGCQGRGYRRKIGEGPL